MKVVVKYKDFASRLDLSIDKVKQLIDEGVFFSTSSLDDATTLYIRHLRKRIKELRQQEAGYNDKSFDFEFEKARLTHHDANLKQIKEKQLLGESLNAKQTVETWEKILSAARSKLLPLGTKAAPHVAREQNENKIKKLLDNLVYEALEELADGLPSLVEIQELKIDEDDEDYAQPQTVETVQEIQDNNEKEDDENLEDLL